MSTPSSLARDGDFSRESADEVMAGVGYWDQAMRCRFVNQFMADWFGVERSEALGRPAAETFGAQRLDDQREAWRLALLGEPQCFDRQEASVDGRDATMHYRLEPETREGQVQGLFVLMVDVTQAREAAQREQRLIHALDLERDKTRAAALAKRTFLANMSHEIRTPMNAIIGLTHLMRRDPGAPQTAERLARVSGAAERLLDLVNDVLDLSKLEAGRMTLTHADFDLDALTARALSQVEANAKEKGLTLQRDTGSLPRIVRGDGARLMQALGHLLTNAVKFTAAGSVTLSGSLTDVHGTALHLRFEVRDTGVGIATDRFDSIFSFEQADGSATRRVGGAGIGLGLARHLARLMGGDVGVSSRLGVGSTFWITAVVGGHVHALEPARSGPLVGKRALIVDDMAEAHALLEPMLRRLGLHVALAASGAEAIRAARVAQDAGTPYDVVMIDWLMPHMDGLETARRLIAQAGDKPLKCILVSVSADERMREQALALGVSSLLRKPVSSSTLHDHLMALLTDAGAAVPPDAGPSAAERTLRASHAGVTVLLAEDNPVNQDVARILLSQVGIHVEVAQTGREAVDMATAKSYRLILMDVQMPELDGLQAARLLRTQPANAATPIIAMTANALVDDRADCLAAGMNDYLSKPVDATSMYEMLNRWLGSPGTAPATPPPTAEPAARTHGVLDLASVEGLNVARGLAFLGGNEAAFRRALLTLAELYAEGLPAAAADLSAPLSPAAIVRLRRELHSVGGACAAIGLEALSAQASRLGERLRNGLPDAEVTDTARALREFTSLLDRTVARIRALQSRADPPPAPG